MKYLLRIALCLLTFGLLTSLQAQPLLQYQISGVSNPDIKKNIDNTLTNMVKSLQSPLDADDVTRFRQESQKKVQEAILPYGFFKPQVTTSIVKDKKGKPIIDYHVTLGKKITIKAVYLKLSGEGANTKPFIKIKENFPIKVGQRLQIPKYNKAKDNLFDKASFLGYFQSKMLNKKIKIDLKNKTAVINIAFDTGPRYRIGKTTFNKTPFAESFLRRFLDYKDGQKYKASSIENTQQNFTLGRYFEKVVVNAPSTKAKNLIIPVSIQLHTLPKIQYMGGVGYGTDTGPRATGGITWRWVNQYGHRFRTFVRASQSNNQATLNYDIPAKNPVTDFYSLEAGAGELNQSSGSSEVLRTSISHTMQYTSDWTQIVALTYLNEHYDLTDRPKTTAKLIYPSIEWDYLFKDKELNPNNGYKLTFKLAGAPNKLSSHRGFIQAYAMSKFLYTFKPTHPRFIVRGSLGETFINNINNLPLSMQLFAGGSQSIRGYAFNSIGPGHNMFTASGEIQQKLFGDLYIAAFYDTGNVANSDLYSKRFIGFGPGLVYLSPVGSIEITYAKAVTSIDKPWKLQFSMGPTL